MTRPSPERVAAAWCVAIPFLVVVGLVIAALVVAVNS